MRLRDFWNRRRRKRWARTIGTHDPVEPNPPQPFQALTHAESKAVVEDAILWLFQETRAVLEMPDGLAKSRRSAELRARDKSIWRDYERLLRGK